MLYVSSQLKKSFIEYLNFEMIFFFSNLNFKVDSEHEKNVATDGWRYSQLNKSLADPNHPYSRFGTGILLYDKKKKLKSTKPNFSFR